MTPQRQRELRRFTREKQPKTIKEDMEIGMTSQRGGVWGLEGEYTFGGIFFSQNRGRIKDSNAFLHH